MERTGLRLRMVAALAALTLGLAGCFVTPGKFTSTLDLRADRAFTFSYEGEIYMLALSKLAQMGAEADANKPFEPDTCYDDDFEQRDCTEEELATQREEWEAGAAERKEQAAQQVEQMKQLLGGIDPSDPEAVEELVARLRSQRGWSRVDYKGDGLFDVSFSVTGRLTHDFVFPTFERFALPQAWVTTSLRQDGKARIDAPGFSQQSGDATRGGMMGMGSLASLAALGAASEGEGPDFPTIPQMEGTFRIVTNGQILSNNTGEGPSAGTGGQVLQWKINRRTTAAPMALVQLQP